MLSKVEDVLNAMYASNFFAKIDPKRVSLAEGSLYLTTFITTNGCHRFKRASLVHLVGITLMNQT